MEKKDIYSILLLVVVVLIGAIYWLLEGYVVSEEIQAFLLEQYPWLGALLTIIILLVVGYVLNKVMRKSKSK